MRTGFNGFGLTETVTVDDEPMASLYTARGARRSKVLTR
jgi:hypothetical protein